MYSWSSERARRERLERERQELEDERVIRLRQQYANDPGMYAPGPNPYSSAQDYADRGVRRILTDTDSPWARHRQPLPDYSAYARRDDDRSAYGPEHDRREAARQTEIERQAELARQAQQAEIQRQLEEQREAEYRHQRDLARQREAQRRRTDDGRRSNDPRDARYIGYYTR